MSLLESIDAFITDVVPVQRFVQGSFVSGIYVPAAPTTLNVPVAIEPATGMQRVVGGRDMRSTEQNEFTSDVRQFFTRTKMFPRTNTNDPDVITYDGSSWTVFRVEPWTIDGETFYRCTMTRQTLGNG